MSEVKWVAALEICPDAIQSIEPNFITATLKNGEKVKVAVYMLDDERVKSFSPQKMLDNFNRANKVESREEYHGAD